MSKRIRENKIYFALILSSIAHIIFLMIPASLPNIFDYSIFKKQQKISKFKVHNLRTVGEKESKSLAKNVYLKEQNKNSRKSKPAKKKLTAKQLAPIFNSSQKFSNFELKKKGDIKSLKKRPKAIKALSLNQKNIKNLLKDSPNSNSAKQFIDALGGTENLVKLEVPKGVKEDELNKHELVFYSFQKRTALSYINSFYKKLNEFELKNPHLKFPLTKKKQRMIGRVIYDKDGNIVKINILKWTNVDKLQDFFVEVLKEMTSIPNPPDQIIKDEKFTVFYSLTVNG